MTPLQEIEKDLDWREAELAILRLTLANNKLMEREKLVLFRAAWALLYAHYEGFCKFSLTVYYDTICRLGKCNRDLPIKMQAIALDKHLKTVRCLPNIELISKINAFSVEYMDKPAEFPDVDTDSNLWPKTLKNLLEGAEIHVGSLDLNNRSISTLVSRRNKIAHGERDIIPEYAYYIKFEDAALTVMYDLAISIDEKLKSF